QGGCHLGDAAARARRSAGSGARPPDPGTPLLVGVGRRAGIRTPVTSFSAVALAEVEELSRYRDRADGTGAAELRRAYDWMRRAGLSLHHRDTITRIPGTPSVRVTRRVHDQYARALEITELVTDTQQDVLVYEFTVPVAV